MIHCFILIFLIKMIRIPLMNFYNLRLIKFLWTFYRNYSLIHLDLSSIMTHFCNMNFLSKWFVRLSWSFSWKDSLYYLELLNWMIHLYIVNFNYKRFVSSSWIFKPSNSLISYELYLCMIHLSIMNFIEHNDSFNWYELYSTCDSLHFYEHSH